MNWEQRKKYYPPIILINAHLAGFLGMMSDWKKLFLSITPFNIILTSILVFFFHSPFSIRFLFFCLLIFLFGFLVEVIGVKTGLIFGSYHYGQTLGWMCFDVPLIMGLNWLLLVYCMGSFLNNFNLNKFIKCFFGASLLLALDLIIEQVAIRYDFWHWKDNLIPLKNYIAWFVISFVFLNLYYIFLVKNTNRLSLVFLLIQYLFFGGILVFS